MESDCNEAGQILRIIWIALLLVFSGLGLWGWQDLRGQVGHERGDNLSPATAWPVVSADPGPDADKALGMGQWCAMYPMETYIQKLSVALRSLEGFGRGRPGWERWPWRAEGDDWRLF